MNTHHYYTDSGILLSGIFKMTYEEGESITFNPNYAPILGFGQTSCVWNFYNSFDKTLIKSVTGNPATTTFTHAEGKQGIDVELSLTWGIQTTRFYKRHRLIIMPDCTAPDAVIDVSTDLTYVGVFNGADRYNLDMAAYSGGEIIELQGTLTCERIDIINLPDSTANPVIFVIKQATTITKDPATSPGDNPLFYIREGDPTNGVWFYGKKNPSTGDRYLVLDGGGIEAYQSSNINSHNNILIAGVKCVNAVSSAFKLKLDIPNRATGSNSNHSFWDCWADAATNEGFYGSCYFTTAYDTVGGYNGYHHLAPYFLMVGCVATNCGWDGIQVTGANPLCEIHDCYSYNNAVLDAGSQNFSFSINNGFAGMFYNNIGNTQMQIQPYGETCFFNNYILAPSGTDFGIFVKRENNPGDGTPSYNLSDPTANFYGYRNLIISDKDSFYLLETAVAVPFVTFNIFNNQLCITGTPVTGQLRYGGAGTTNVDNNLVTTELELGIEDKDELLLSTTKNNPIQLVTGADYDSILEGATTSGWFAKIGLTDITGQNSELNGYKKKTFIIRPTEHTEIDPSKSQIQWYQTAQTSVFSDKEKVPDYFKYQVKTTDIILDGAKPRLLGAVRPVAITGNKYGVETFDDVSN